MLSIWFWNWHIIFIKIDEPLKEFMLQLWVWKKVANWSQIICELTHSFVFTCKGNGKINAMISSVDRISHWLLSFYNSRCSFCFLCRGRCTIVSLCTTIFVISFMLFYFFMFFYDFTSWPTINLGWWDKNFFDSWFFH